MVTIIRYDTFPTLRGGEVRGEEGPRPCGISGLGLSWWRLSAVGSCVQSNPRAGARVLPAAYPGISNLRCCRPVNRAIVL